MADIIFNRFKMGLLQGDYNLLEAGDDVKVMLTDSVYVPDADLDLDVADGPRANEVSGTNYVADGFAITNQAVTQDDTDNEGVFDGDDAVWANSTITARHGVIYQDTAVDTTSLLIADLDFVSDQTTSNTEFKITWNAEGIVNLT